MMLQTLFFRHFRRFPHQIPKVLAVTSCHYSTYNRTVLKLHNKMLRQKSLQESTLAGIPVTFTAMLPNITVTISNILIIMSKARLFFLTGRPATSAFQCSRHTPCTENPNGCDTWPGRPPNSPTAAILPGHPLPGTARPANVTARVLPSIVAAAKIRPASPARQDLAIGTHLACIVNLSDSCVSVSRSRNDEYARLCFL